MIRTADASNVGITFKDETSFSLDENAEMTLDEMVYDPDTGDGSFSSTLTSGVFSFVSGQISKANPDAMSITTPVATIGIRGTQGVLKLENGGKLEAALLEEPGGFTGELILTNGAGSSILNQPNQFSSVVSFTSVPGKGVVVDSIQISGSFGTKTIQILNNTRKNATARKAAAAEADAEAEAAAAAEAETLAADATVEAEELALAAEAAAAGDDNIKGGDGDDVIIGGEGNDYLWGDAGNDYLHGDVPDGTGDFSEIIDYFGTLGTVATSGADHLYGGLGKDHLYGGNGADTLEGGDGADTLSGGDGDDIFSYVLGSISSEGGDYISDFGASGAADHMYFSAMTSTLHLSTYSATISRPIGTDVLGTSFFVTALNSAQLAGFTQSTYQTTAQFIFVAANDQGLRELIYAGGGIAATRSYESVATFAADTTLTANDITISLSGGQMA